MLKRCYLFLLTGCMLTAACNQPKTVATVTLPAQKIAIMAPFRFHKLIEVGPGNDFDILSWGRGSSEVGSFLILHSDSTSLKYTTTTGDMDGSIIDVYNSDMDLDGNPEILIQAKANDTTNYAIIYAFEFTNGKAQKLDFPKLTTTQKKGYRGNDNFYIEDGKFMRQFPIYDGNGKGAKPTGQKRLLQYGLRDNEFTVQTLIKDSTQLHVAQPISHGPVVEPNTPAPAKKDKTSSSKKKKHHEATEHKKKKKKHHHNSD